MTWNYRIISDGNEYWIGEVYYEGGEHVAYSDSVGPHGETVNEMMEDMERMAEALLKPVITAW